jgi:hypothetical protein
VGQLVETSTGREWTDPKGGLHTPYVVKVLVGDEVVKVEFPSAAAAAEILNGNEVGETVQLKVYLRPTVYKDGALLFFRGAGAPRDGSGTSG